MEKYYPPKIEIFHFSAVDIITTSANPDELPDDDWE